MKIAFQIRPSEGLVSGEFQFDTTEKKFLVFEDGVVKEFPLDADDIPDGTAANDLLVWDTATSKWKKVTLAALKTLLAVPPVGTADNDISMWDATAGAWVKKTLAEAKTAFGIPTGTADSDFLVWDNTSSAWVKKTLAETKTILGIV